MEQAAPSLEDVRTFIQVMRVGSLNGAARGMGVEPSRVSKAVARLERRLGLKLPVRTARGVELTDAGAGMAPRLLDLLARVESLRSGDRSPEMAIAAPSFLWSVVAARLGPLLGETSVHAVETSSRTLTGFASQPLFDAAIAVGETAWPGAWPKLHVGVVRRALFTTPRKARELGRRVSAVSLRRERFVGRLLFERGQLMLSDDGCPLSPGERLFGHRAQTVAMALELARQSDQLVFAPVLAARALVRRKALVEVRVAGWDVREPVHVVCHQDRVSARVQRALANTTRAVLEAQDR
jgi:DNA-binding transcriptional LysR family regulator